MYMHVDIYVCMGACVLHGRGRLLRRAGTAVYIGMYVCVYKYVLSLSVSVCLCFCRTKTLAKESDGIDRR